MCFFAVSVKKNNTTYAFEVISNQTPASYVAVAISDFDAMSDATVMECVRNSDDKVYKYDSWMTNNPRRGVSRENIPQNVSKLIKSDSHPYIICHIERPAMTIVNDKVFDLDENPYHILIASGSMSTGKKPPSQLIKIYFN